MNITDDVFDFIQQEGANGPQLRKISKQFGLPEKETKEILIALIGEGLIFRTVLDGQIRYSCSKNLRPSEDLTVENVLALLRGNAYGINRIARELNAAVDATALFLETMADKDQIVRCDAAGKARYSGKVEPGTKRSISNKPTFSMATSRPPIDFTKVYKGFNSSVMSRINPDSSYKSVPANLDNLREELKNARTSN